MPPSFTTLRRDPIARHDVVRAIVYGPFVDGCTECGNKRVSPKGRESLFKYGYWSDAKPQPYYLAGLFCCIECFNAHHNHPFNP